MTASAKQKDAKKNKKMLDKEMKRRLREIGAPFLQQLPGGTALFCSFRFFFTIFFANYTVLYGLQSTCRSFLQ
jgi:hypothetical protein